jgi:hypothetical protein
MKMNTAVRTLPLLSPSLEIFTRRLVLVPCAMFSLFASLMQCAYAGMGESATAYGLGPSNVGSVQSFSLFSDDAWSVYYNPAAMARSKTGYFSAVVQHGEQDLRATSIGGPDPFPRNSDTLQSTDSQLLLIGLKSSLSGATSFDHPIYFGINIGVDEYSKNILPFSANTERAGQYLRYGQQPLYLSFGGATEIFSGVNAGFSARINIHAQATLEARSDLSGNTDSEKLSLSAKPSVSPTVGVNLIWSDMLCGQDKCLPRWLGGLETSIVWRGDSEVQTAVDADVVIPGVIPAPGLALSLFALDTYQPEVIGVGFLYPLSRWSIALSVEQQKWSTLADRLEKDSVRNQANLEFDDTLVPRLGVQWQCTDALKLSAGLAIEKSPLKGRRSEDVNFLDSDKTVAGLGAAYRFNRVIGLSVPLELAVGYQYQQLEPRDFELTFIGSSSAPDPYETVRAEGEIHIVSGSVSLQF